MNDILTCTLCGSRFGYEIFHVTTSTGHVYCEQCLFKQMAKKRGGKK